MAEPKPIPVTMLSGFLGSGAFLYHEAAKMVPRNKTSTGLSVFS